jgi:hypothetical protein
MAPSSKVEYCCSDVSGPFFAIVMVIGCAPYG